MVEVVGTSNTGIGVFGESNGGDGVQGRTREKNHSGGGFVNEAGGQGVFGFGSPGVKGQSDAGVGALGQSNTGDGVQGITAEKSHSGVAGINNGGGNGVFGFGSPGIHGEGGPAIGVVGRSAGDDGVQGTTSQKGRSGVAGIHTGGGNGIFGLGAPAGRFQGDVEVTGDIRLLNGQDCAEDFDVANLKDSQPGTVMVLNQNGVLEVSSQAYDKKVAGVISGAGDFRAGIILGKQLSEIPRVPIALLGKVYCKVDARRSPIEVGDLLTTSDTPGHAMKAQDPLRAFGAVIGKALHPLQGGQGLVPILIALQ